MKRLRTMAFFNLSRSCVLRLLAVRRARTSAASAGSVGNGGWAAFCYASVRLASLFKARATARVERLSLASRQASARKAASLRGRLVGEAFSMGLGSYQPIRSCFTRLSQPAKRGADAPRGPTRRSRPCGW